jgi:hypothetical protein
VASLAAKLWLALVIVAGFLFAVSQTLAVALILLATLIALGGAFRRKFTSNSNATRQAFPMVEVTHITSHRAQLAAKNSSSRRNEH